MDAFLKSNRPEGIIVIMDTNHTMMIIINPSVDAPSKEVRQDVVRFSYAAPRTDRLRRLVGGVSERSSLDSGTAGCIDKLEINILK